MKDRKCVKHQACLKTHIQCAPQVMVYMQGEQQLTNGFSIFHGFSQYFWTQLFCRGLGSHCSRLPPGRKAPVHHRLLAAEPKAPLVEQQRLLEPPWGCGWAMARLCPKVPAKSSNDVLQIFGSKTGPCREAAVKGISHLHCRQWSVTVKSQTLLDRFVTYSQERMSVDLTNKRNKGFIAVC